MNNINSSKETVLNKVLCGEIALRDFILWLKSNNSDVTELKVIQNYEFIPFFLNYIKHKCSWITPNDKSSDICDKNNLKKSSSTLHPNEVKQTEFVVNHNPSNFSDNQINSNFSVRHSAETNGIKKSFNCRDNSNYKGHNKTESFKTENTKKHLTPRAVLKPIPQTPDLENLNAFPPLGAKVDDTKTRRRITPTPVQKTNNFNSKFEKSRFSSHSTNITNEVFKNTTFQDNRFDLQYERELLKVTRNTLPKQTPVPENITKTKSLDVRPCQTQSLDQFIFPNPECINMLNEISCFSEIYCFLLSEALTPNITTELYFLFELITSKIPEGKSSCKDLFGSIHNCVFFAVSVLADQCDLLQMFDNATLASLKEIPYLLKFSPQLIDFIICCISSKSDDSPVLPSLTVVPFQLEEDSRSNFPDEYSFVCFKKQRDLFYEILREWQQSMECVDDRFKSNFLRKVRQLISLGPSSVNMFHLAKLFQSQLIASCMCLEVNEVYDELLNDIQKNHPDKFKKLQERFLTPSNTGGLNPLPSFYGIQTFFSELIYCADSPSLNQHLINAFVCKILELNNTDIFSDKELSTLGTVKDKYVFLLHTLRLLGKFLGYVYFLPYTKEGSMPEHIIKQQVASRQLSPPLFNLSNLLIDSVKNRQAVITVPWIVEYLSMVDPIGKLLNDVQDALSILLRIYQCKNIFPKHDNQSHLFLQIIIGWLFDILHFPKDFVNLVKPGCELPFSTGYGIDSLSIIDKQLIHSCCPYLIEFKVIIYNFLNGIKDKKREIRKITPLSTVASNPVKSHSTNKRQLEYHMEENFFSLHSSSIKKTTDFVSERMASKVITKIRLEVTNAKLKIVEELTNLNQKMANTNQNNCKEDINELLEEKISNAFNNMRDMISTSIQNIQSEIHSFLPALLSEDTKQMVTAMCCKISIRMAVDKILEWGNANLLHDAIKSDIQNKIHSNSKLDNNIEIDDNLNISELINSLRKIVVQVHSQSAFIQLEYIQSLFNKLSELLPNMSMVIQKNVFHLTVDLYIAILVYYPDEFCEKISGCFIQFWLKCPEHVILGKMFLSPKNLKFISKSKNLESSQAKILDMVKLLLKKNIMCMDELHMFAKDFKESQNQNFNQLDILDKELTKLCL